MSPYAKLEVTVIALLGSIVTAVVAYYFQVWAVLPALLSLAMLAFYRDPPRRPTPGAGLLLSPADGKIMLIEKRVDGEGSPELRIVVFLSVLNVHMNRSPCAGRVREIIYQRGAMLNALKPEATERNESNTLVIDAQAPLPSPVRVRQITGALARRIVCAAKIGDELQAGQRYGMIKLGSQTEIRVPDDSRWIVGVSVGDKVRAGQTVLARIDDEVAT